MATTTTTMTTTTTTPTDAIEEAAADDWRSGPEGLDCAHQLITMWSARLSASEGVVDQTLVSWNGIAAWLSRVEALQNVRSFGLRPQD